MGLFDLFKKPQPAGGTYVPNPQPKEWMPSSTLAGKAVKVYGTIYHQDVIARLPGGAVHVYIRPTQANDQFGWYDYQVFTIDGQLVGALNQKSVERAQIKNWQALAIIEHGTPDEQDRHRLFIPYAEIRPERWKRRPV